MKNKKLEILCLMPISKKVLPYATGVQAIINALNYRSDLSSEIYFATLEDNKAVEYSHATINMDDVDIILFGLTSPGSILDYLKMMEEVGISPIKTVQYEAQRKPLVCAGGWGMFNPEPFAGFFDIIFLGNAINSIINVCESLLFHGNRHTDEFWKETASIPSIYIPHLYNFTFDDGGRISSISPIYNWAPTKVKYGVDAEDFNMPVVLVDDVAILTVTRGCDYHCAFCQIGSEHYREADIDVLKEGIREVVAKGVKEIVVNSATLAHYSHIGELLDALSNACKENPDIKIIIGSLRADELDENILSKMVRINNFSSTLRYYTHESKQTYLTIAPEVGSNEVRMMLGKNMKNHELYRAIELAQQYGINNFILYFIIGFDFYDKIEDVVTFVRNVLLLTKESAGQIVIRITPFIPSVRTPMQRFGILGVSRIWNLMEQICNSFEEDELSRLQFSHAMTQGRYIYEAICMRGDRRISQVLISLYKKGLTQDTATFKEVKKIMQQEGIELDWYMRRIGKDEIVPWTVVDEISDQIQWNLLSKLTI